MVDTVTHLLSTRVGERGMRRFELISQVQRFVTVHSAISDLAHGEFVIYRSYQRLDSCCPTGSFLTSIGMKDVFYLLFNLLPALAKIIRPGGSRTVIALHSKSIWHSDWIWTRTPCGEYLLSITNRIPPIEAHPGLRLSAMRKIACGALICSAQSPLH